jgi:hypothetical protein
MTTKELFVADLKATLEETSNAMADRIILESLAKHGSVTLEEAEFYDKLVRKIITEAAEEFVPEKLELPTLEEMGMGMPAVAEGPEMTLTGEDGTVYTYNPATGELTPVEGAEGSEEGDAGLEDLESNEAAVEDSEEPSELKESTEVTEETTELTESTEVVEEAAEEVELTESQLIVSNLIKSLGN